MRMICKMRGHQPGAETWNEGLFYATCGRCRGDIVRQRGGAWEVVPAGVRVVWHPAGHQGLHWSKVISRARAKKAELPTAALPMIRQAEGDK
ncbi:hypothetical protein [Sphingomonas hylomeconis]|nr:hypothetical protein [Sphingomonas hylomeconis]